MNPPKLVQLDPPGPYILPAVETYQATTIAQGRLPVQLRLFLENGTELHLPIAAHAFEKLLHDFHGLHEARLKNQR